MVESPGGGSFGIDVDAHDLAAVVDAEGDGDRDARDFDGRRHPCPADNHVPHHGKSLQKSTIRPGVHVSVGGGLDGA